MKYFTFLCFLFLSACAPKAASIDVEPKELNLELGQIGRLRIVATSTRGEKIAGFYVSQASLYFTPTLVDLLRIDDGTLVVSARKCGDENVPIMWRDFSTSIRIKVPCRPSLMEDSPLACAGENCIDRDTGCVYWARTMTPRYGKDGKQQGCKPF